MDSIDNFQSPENTISRSYQNLRRRSSVDATLELPPSPTAHSKRRKSDVTFQAYQSVITSDIAGSSSLPKRGILKHQSTHISSEDPASIAKSPPPPPRKHTSVSESSRGSSPIVSRRFVSNVDPIGPSPPSTTTRSSKRSNPSFEPIKREDENAKGGLFSLLQRQKSYTKSSSGSPSSLRKDKRIMKSSGAISILINDDEEEEEDAEPPPMPAVRPSSKTPDAELPANPLNPEETFKKNRSQSADGAIKVKGGEQNPTGNYDENNEPAENIRDKQSQRSSGTSKPSKKLPSKSEVDEGSGLLGKRLGASHASSMNRSSTDALGQLHKLVEVFIRWIENSRLFKFIKGLTLSTRFQIYFFAFFHVCILSSILCIIFLVNSTIFPSISYYNLVHALLGFLGPIGLAVGMHVAHLISVEYVAGALIKNVKGVPLSLLASSNMVPEQGRSLRKMAFWSMLILEGTLWYLLLAMVWTPAKSELGVFGCIPATYPHEDMAFLKNLPGFLEGDATLDEWFMVSGGQLTELVLGDLVLTQSMPQKLYFNQILPKIESNSIPSKLIKWFTHALSLCLNGTTYTPTQAGHIANLFQWGRTAQGLYDINQTRQGLSGSIASMSHYVLLQYDGTQTTNCTYYGVQDSGSIAVGSTCRTILVASCVLCFAAQMMMLLRWALTSGGGHRTDFAVRILKNPLNLLYFFRHGVTAMIPSRKDGDHSRRKIRQHMASIYVRLGEDQRTRAEKVGIIVIGAPKKTLKLSESRPYL
ncbi:hypothetical protein BC830DRAFT_1174169 [Chytriomyces sp. MP71]|nr:hypothetical protein BC830DRAFT_1174169 [Chytriomyces sp. MP71]